MGTSALKNLIVLHFSFSITHYSLLITHSFCPNEQLHLNRLVAVAKLVGFHAHALGHQEE